MFAVFVDGSRQYRVSEGDRVRVDYRPAEAKQQIEFNRVLLYKNGDELKFGQPVLEGTRVLAEVESEVSEKVYVQHFRRRKNYRRLRGHRQPYVMVRIKHILLPGQEPPAAPPPETTSTPTTT
ncbi:MAG TPA: 50S ribosomal protein L21 [Gemmataceae bacterium]|jgi:large subunit ribosomal protein L21|nr:50S ribosomal protein L21 [Gemmataceae bacterium]